MNSIYLLAGCGPMAVEYAKVLEALKQEFIVVGRGELSAAKFKENTGKDVITGGVEAWCNNSGENEIKGAIIAVGEKHLGTVTKQVLDSGIKDILVEKPGGLNAADIISVAECAERNNARVFVGYNRRFFKSTIKAKEIIKKDGGVTSFNFEFTEWSHVIKDLVKESGVKENWFLHNSSHVIDLAFYLGGVPKEMTSFVSGSLDWHPSASIFSGSGISDAGALFSYQANWESPGRWSVEILTRKHRLIFRPIEKLQIQKIGSVKMEFVDIADELDEKFKPGLYKQVKAFINNRIDDSLCSIKEQKKNLDYYSCIGKGQNLK